MPFLESTADDKTTTQTDLFQPVGAAAETVDNAANQDDERVVDEIESLCMNCHENVRSNNL